LGRLEPDQRHIDPIDEGGRARGREAQVALGGYVIQELERGRQQRRGSRAWPAVGGARRRHGVPAEGQGEPFTQGKVIRR
jgi:hypothetical protein